MLELVRQRLNCLLDPIVVHSHKRVVKQVFGALVCAHENIAEPLGVGVWAVYETNREL